MPAATISEKRLAANRANARKSTGPRTAAGKAASCGNARRTGAYSANHQMPARIETHFRALAEAATRDIANPQRRALSFELQMLQGHARLHESRERALFNAGLEYGRGNEAVATQWVLRQVGFIQALNRYAGWIEAQTRRVQRALDALPAEPVPAEAPKPIESMDESTEPTADPAISPNAPSPAQPTLVFEGSNPPQDTRESAHSPAASRKPKPDFEGTNPPAPQPPGPPQQPEPLPQPAPRHRRGPIPTTTTPEPNPNHAPPNLQLKGDLEHQPQGPQTKPAVAEAESVTESTDTHQFGLPQQPQLLPQHAPRHRRPPIPTTTTPEPNPTHRQPARPSNPGSLSQPCPQPPAETTHSPPEPFV
ncbi:hypothetical protein [Paludibaculum fermentans]|uniref:Uncharacterized protein n=1 Tax=Paludibaculum fermentans TaxID=1473598 RepID=A0A7S7SKT1_PALFE|nr:hypothetical protein [Paludibaculum fermentans]QOY88674.1 hypothetical protein IRI77_01560 [Paludibaculum fermentans]